MSIIYLLGLPLWLLPVAANVIRQGKVIARLSSSILLGIPILLLLVQSLLPLVVAALQRDSSQCMAFYLLGEPLTLLLRDLPYLILFLIILLGNPSS